MSDNEDNVPEPGGEPDSESSNGALVALQDQMVQMMAMFQASTSSTGQQIANILAEQELTRRGMSMGGIVIRSGKYVLIFARSEGSSCTEGEYNIRT